MRGLSTVTTHQRLCQCGCEKYHTEAESAQKKCSATSNRAISSSGAQEALKKSLSNGPDDDTQHAGFWLVKQQQNETCAPQEAGASSLTKAQQDLHLQHDASSHILYAR